MLLLTDRQVENNSSANVKLSKMQIFKIAQSGGFLGKFVGPLLKIGFSWATNILTLSTENILMPLGLTAVATHAGSVIPRIFWIYQ